MKKIIYTAVLAALCGFSVRADESGTLNKSTGPAALADSYAGRFGAGIILGEPTGASLKYWLNDTMAIDGAIGWSGEDEAGLYLHGDVLWHKFDVFNVSRGRLPVYIGVGGLVRLNDDNNSEAGVRVPIGVSYMFDNAPVDIFVEIAPTIDLTPDAHGEITGGIGVRFWF